MNNKQNDWIKYVFFYIGDIVTWGIGWYALIYTLISVFEMYPYITTPKISFIFSFMLIAAVFVKFETLYISNFLEEEHKKIMEKYKK